MDQLIHIPLTNDEVSSCLKKALAQQLTDNLRSRHKNVQLDSKLRGYVGETAFKKWMNKQGILFSDSNVMDASNGMDVDFIFEKNNKKLHLELKTSLVPDYDEILNKVIQKRDIKLIRRGTQSIEQLNGDVHIQFFFKQLRIRKDEWLKKQEIKLEADLDKIYESIAAYRYESDTYFVAWIDKPTLIRLHKEKLEHLKKWKYGKREFWCCNLTKDAKRPAEIVDYLKNI